MKKYTQEEFDNLPLDQYGTKQCPQGDYSAVKTNGEGCSFGEWCSFGKGCKYMTFVFTTLTCLFGCFKYPIYIYQNKDKYVLSIGCKNFKSLDGAVKEAEKIGCYCEKTHKVLKILLEAK